MAALLKHWREAATLILVTKARNQPYRTQKHDYDYEILMLKRSSKSKFMPSVYVFPGGVASDADFSREWLDMYSKDTVQMFHDFWTRGGKGPFMFSRKREDKFSFVPSELAFRICAIRETFEESGVLLVKQKEEVLSADQNIILTNPVYGTFSEKESSSLERWRTLVDKDANQFLVMCKELDVVPDVWALSEWSNWLTPLQMRTNLGKPQGKRFDTAFFLCVLDQVPAALHDNKETVHLMWCSPDELMKSYLNSKANLAPPQVYELMRILNHKSADELNKFNWRRSALRVERYFPVPVICSDGLLILYPGDELYPESPDFHGEVATMSLSETIAECNARCQQKNRNLITSPKDNTEMRVLHTNLVVTSTPVDGQLPPVSDDSQLNQPPHAKL